MQWRGTDTVVSVTTHAAVTAISSAPRTRGPDLGPGSVVTPEGVVLQYAPAGLGTRIVSRLVDLGIQGVVLIVAITAIGLVGGALPSGVVFALFAVLGFLIIFVYPVVLELRGRRQTFGQRAVNVRIISLDGGPLRFRQAAVRAMLLLIDLPLTSGFAAVATMFASSRGQRLGDIAAGTMAVRLPSTNLSNLAAPAAIVAFELDSELDLRTLTDDEIDLARDLLGRGAEMRPGAQTHFARTLSDRFAERLGAPRPSGWSYEQHLQAVVAARSAAGSHRIASWR